METSLFPTDKIIKRLRWIMAGVILFDFLNTILGQPSSYWQHHETADEGNRLFHFFMLLGPSVWILSLLIYVATAFFVVSVRCERAALIVLFAYIFGHYQGACSWLIHRWQLGTAGAVIYGLILAIAIVGAAFPASDRTA